MSVSWFLFTLLVCVVIMTHSLTTGPRESQNGVGWKGP